MRRAIEADMARDLKEHGSITIQCFDGVIVMVTEATDLVMFHCPRHTSTYQVAWPLVAIAAHIDAQHGGLRRE